MKRQKITIDERGVQFDGFPNAVAIVRVRSKKAKTLADMALHRADLEFSLGCISRLNDLSPGDLIHEALWRSAVIHFIKCFGGSVRRGRLSARAVYRHAPGGAIDWFEQFDNLRNKHFVHDESGHSQCVIGAIINAEGEPSKVAEIVGSQMTITTFDKEGLDYLKRLVEIALAWVEARFDDLSKAIKKELEAMTRKTLLAMEPPTLQKPTAANMWRRDAP